MRSIVLVVQRPNEPVGFEVVEVSKLEKDRVTVLVTGGPVAFSRATGKCLLEGEGPWMFWKVRREDLRSLGKGKDAPRRKR